MMTFTESLIQTKQSVCLGFNYAYLFIPELDDIIPTFPEPC